MRPKAEARGTGSACRPQATLLKADRHPAEAQREIEADLWALQIQDHASGVLQPHALAAARDRCPGGKGRGAARDVGRGYYTTTQARELFGVAVTDVGTVDTSVTATLRKAGAST